jgi:hypothetical protein
MFIVAQMKGFGLQPRFGYEAHVKFAYKSDNFNLALLGGQTEIMEPITCARHLVQMMRPHRRRYFVA